jgi:hypothetical protein
MAIRPVYRKAVQSQIDWPIVGLAGAMAVVLVLSTTLMAWVASRSMNSVGRAACSPIGLSGCAASERESVADVHSHGERGNEEVVQAAAYPEGDEQTVTSADNRSDGSAEHAGAPASPSRSEPKGQIGNEIQPAKAGSCEQGANEAPTRVLFAKDPMEAAELAKKEHKLMFVLHVSGNFEESKFT